MKLLALDTSTDYMSIAVLRDDHTPPLCLQHSAAGGAQASATLIPAVLALLAQSGLRLAELDAICFGAGPGSFTGLRTACSVAQGLAFGAGVPVLAIHSLLALAEEARWGWCQEQAGCNASTDDVGAGVAPGGLAALQVSALLDARMDEMYAASFYWDGARWNVLQDSALVKPEALALLAAPPEASPSVTHLLAGNVFAAYGARLGAQAAAMPRRDALPTAAAMLRLAPALLRAGLAVPPAQALPLYVRDKVAQTTAERAAIKADKERLI